MRFKQYHCILAFLLRGIGIDDYLAFDRIQSTIFRNTPLPLSECGSRVYSSNRSQTCMYFLSTVFLTASPLPSAVVVQISSWERGTMSPVRNDLAVIIYGTSSSFLLAESFSILSSRVGTSGPRFENLSCLYFGGLLLPPKSRSQPVANVAK